VDTVLRPQSDIRLHHAGHGDHFFGIKQILEAFAAAKAVATIGSVKEAHAKATPAWLDVFWERLFPGQILIPVVYPEVLDSDAIDLEGHRLEVIQAGFRDTTDTTSIWVPDLRLTMAGDVAYNDTHQ
jgi:glyoxylase-like metal-dependent hydrolase (beta-lactamase superfamily II)